ncbi:ATPase WRNIP1 isoform X2 [Ambystoma mexicanum]|uniref:ATPase WRNIP1 isoform X2 n=1 Tax=Ambystoma mexicanum TaxID=8296 RepID=UPI0037E7AFB0
MAGTEVIKLESEGTEERVSCPVCAQELPASRINVHLDRCLQPPASVNDTPGSPPVPAMEEGSQSSKKRRLSASSTTFPLFHRPRPGLENASCPSSAPSCPSPAAALPQQYESGKSIPERLEGKPLADRMRPATLDDYMGQGKVLGAKTLLRSLLESNEVPSIILWGPPGCGKDTFLPHVECGTVTLIGATTENPSFQVNAALLSRCRVIVLEKLSVEAMEAILTRAVNSLGIRVLDQDGHSDAEDGDSGGSAEIPVYIEEKALSTLAHLCDGDARIGLNGLQLAAQAILAVGKQPNSLKPEIVITEDHVKEGLQRSHILYDRAGEEHYNCISALHKSMRGSDANASLYWLARMLEGGEDPLYVARRLVRFASEDVGLADPSALPQAVAAFQGCHLIGMPECEVLLAQCVVYLARAPKSIEVYSAYNNVKACLKNQKGPLPPVPLHLRNAPTKLMKGLGYGQGYKYNPMFKGPVDQDYLPEELKGMNFFKKAR